MSGGVLLTEGCHKGKLKAMRKPQAGFTLVELLIVIVVIAILAAITLVAYNGIQDRANDTTVKSDLSSMSRQVQAFHAENGSYPESWEFFAGNNNMDIKPTKSAYDTDFYNLYYCTNGDNFGIAARSKSDQTFTISSTSSLIENPNLPSWYSSCGTFGPTEDSTEDWNLYDFDYAYTLDGGSGPHWAYFE